MKYLTETANPTEMLKDSLILDFKELWWKMAFADVVVDLFETSTWEGVDYEPLLNITHAKIAPHAVYQERCKNYVQMAALTASNNVSEARCSNRSVAILFLMRDFNRESANEVNENRKKEGKKKIARVEGRKRVEMFSKYCDHFNESTDKARVEVKDNQYRCLIDFIDGDKNRISRVDLKARKENMQRKLSSRAK